MQTGRFIKKDGPRHKYTLLFHAFDIIVVITSSPLFAINVCGAYLSVTGVLCMLRYLRLCARLLIGDT